MRFKEYVVLLIFCLFSLIHAQNKTESKLNGKQSWKNKIKQQIEKLIKSNKNNARAFTGNIANVVNSLDEYGCWCYFYDNVGRGAGQPVDYIDSVCKIMADGYQCAIVDSENSGCSCVPWEVYYEPGTGSLENLWASCQSLNEGNDCDAQCATYACAVEGRDGNEITETKSYLVLTRLVSYIVPIFAHSSNNLAKK